MQDSGKIAETFTFHPASSAWSTKMVAIPILLSLPKEAALSHPAFKGGA
jgi:hypothetical protein